MHKRMTVTLDQAVYDGLRQMVGRDKISQFIEDLLRPHVLGPSEQEERALDESYRAMAADEAREAEAQEWGYALIGDIPDEPW